MAPVALDGQVVICDDIPPVDNDLVVCCLTGRGAIFRRFGLVTQAGTITLHTVNPAHGGEKEFARDQIESIHRVIGVRFIVE